MAVRIHRCGRPPSGRHHHRLILTFTSPWASCLPTSFQNPSLAANFFPLCFFCRPHPTPLPNSVTTYRPVFQPSSIPNPIPRINFQFPVHISSNIPSFHTRTSQRHGATQEGSKPLHPEEEAPRQTSTILGRLPQRKTGPYRAGRGQDRQDGRRTGEARYQYVEGTEESPAAIGRDTKSRENGNSREGPGIQHGGENG